MPVAGDSEHTASCEHRGNDRHGAEQLGVVPAAATPIGVTLLIAPVTILIANAIAALPGRAAARTRPALVLRSE